MPRGNRTGPEGNGPRTGRAMGYCSGSNAPGYTQGSYGSGMGYARGAGRGYGRGMGFNRGVGPGRGYGRGGIFPVAPIPDFEPKALSAEEEKKYLENLLGGMEKEIADIKKRLEDLTSEE